MNEIERTLELIQTKKISPVEGVKLLQVLSPKLIKIKQSTWDKIFNQLENGLNSSEIAEIINIEPDFGSDSKQPSKTAKLIRLSIDGVDGTEVRVNIPIGLASFAMKMIPKEAQEVMKDKGLDIEDLSALLKNDLPDGEIFSLEANDGTEITLNIE